MGSCHTKQAFCFLASLGNNDGKRDDDSYSSSARWARSTSVLVNTMIPTHTTMFAAVNLLSPNVKKMRLLPC